MRQIDNVHLGEQLLKHLEEFKYLRSVVRNNRGCRAGSMKWQQATGIHYDKRMSIKLNVKLYRIVVQSVTPYGPES